LDAKAVVTHLGSIIRAVTMHIFLVWTMAVALSVVNAQSSSSFSFTATTKSMPGASLTAAPDVSPPYTPPNPTTPGRFEIDIIYPRNDTYNTSSLLPIVIAIQNPSAPLRIGSFSLEWSIEPYGNGNEPAGITVGTGLQSSGWLSAANFTTNSNLFATGGSPSLDNGKNETYFYVSYSNMSAWYNHLEFENSPPHDIYALNVAVWFSWQESPMNETCGPQPYWYPYLPDKNVFFSAPFNGTGKAVDVKDAVGQCGYELGVIGLSRNDTANATCPGFLLDYSGPSGSPCAVNVTEEIVRSLESQVAVLAAPPSPAPAPTQTAAPQNGAARMGELTSGSLLVTVIVFVFLF
jgi:hypothetical protein